MRHPASIPQQRAAPSSLMNRVPTKTPGTPCRLATVPLAALGLLLAGCAAPAGQLFGTADAVPLFHDKALSVQDARDSIAAGRSTKAQTLAALGKATVVKFDSGYEVWAYRGTVADSKSTAKTEFIVLFGPDGVLKKTRIRAPLDQ